jgi:ornithine cyclodeaminase/alanine dehydrogenase-like protein (mu-crystallin family)
VVEDTATALREAGDIILAVNSGALTAGELVDLTAISGPGPSIGISVFKSVGMAWQDLAIAQAIVAT